MNEKKVSQMGHRLILSLVLLLTAAGAASQDPRLATVKPDPDAVRVRIRLMEIAVGGSVKERDVERFKSYLAPRAVFLAEEVGRGRDEIAAIWRPFFDDGGPRISYQPERIGVAASGDLAYVVGEATVSQLTRGDHERTRQGPYLTAWGRDGDGKWKLLGSGSLVVCLEEECGETVDWRAGLAEVWEPLQAADDGGGLATEVEVTWEAMAGDLAVHAGTYTLEAPGETSTETASGGYLSVLKKDVEGVWQVVAGSFSVPR